MYDSYFPHGGSTQPDVLFTPIRNFYPTAQGGTLATLGAAASPDTYVDRGSMTAAVATTQPARNSIAWWVAIGVLVALMLIAARKTGNADEFKNLRASTYNVLFITLVAILGLTAAKVFATKLQQFGPTQGLADVILAA